MALELVVEWGWVGVTVACVAWGAAGAATVGAGAAFT